MVYNSLFFIIFIFLAEIQYRRNPTPIFCLTTHQSVNQRNSTIPKPLTRERLSPTSIYNHCYSHRTLAPALCEAKPKWNCLLARATGKAEFYMVAPHTDPCI